MIDKVYVFSPELTLLGFLDVLTGLTWEEEYADTGSFELWTPLTETTRSLLIEDNLVWNGSVTAGIIESKDLNLSITGEESIHVRGRLCSSYLERRVLYPVMKKSGKSSTVLRAILDKYVISPSDSSRKLSQIIQETSDPELGDLIQYQCLGDSVLDACRDISQASNLGFRLKFLPKQKQFLFEVYQGINHTINQTVNVPVLFSSELDDLLDSSYSSNRSEFRNFAYIAGEDSGGDRKVTSIGAESGLNRRELFVDARDLQSENEDGSVMSSSQYTSLLQERGREKLTEYQDIQTFSTSLRVFGQTAYTYGTDYNLGDIVTVFDTRLSIRVNAQITAVTHSYDGDGESLELTLGYAQPTIAKKLQRRG